jgi:Leucine-rich repeat (LRR) protein
MRVVVLSGLKLRYIPEKFTQCLKNRKSLSLSLNQNNFSDINSLNSLKHVKHLMRIDLANSNITDSSVLGFIQGMNLTQINIRNNNLPAVEVKKIICMLGSEAIKKIDAGGSKIGYINDDFFSCLAKAKLNALILERCNITGVSKLALRYFHGMLSLNLAHNRIPVDDLSFVAAARYVQSIQLGQNGFIKFPDFKVNGSCIGIKALTDLHLVGNYISTIREEDTQCLHKLQSLTLSENKIVILPKGALRNLTHLKVLSLGGNKMERLGKDSLPLELIELDLLGNNFQYYGLVPIGQLNNLYKLSISATNDLWISLFINKTKLTTLHIENGNIANINGILQTVTSLVYLRLVQINMRMIPNEILDLKHLRRLALGNNKIEIIPRHFIPKLNSLETFRVSNNYFACNCSLEPFSNWLRNESRQTIVTDLDHTNCFSPAYYKGTPLFNFEKDCRNLLPIILSSILVPIMLLIVVITTVSVRYRGYIRYGCMLIRARWRGYGAIEGRSFRYDAFVSYNHNDAAWVLRELRPKLEDQAGFQICLHDRDFTIGEEIVDNIITSIDESRKTVLVVSDDFAQSQWCQLEMSLAQHKLFEEHRDVLILIRLGEVAEENISRTMRMLMRTKTYITWPEGQEGLDLFWKNLTFALRRPPGVVMEDPEWPVGGAAVQDAANG